MRTKWKSLVKFTERNPDNFTDIYAVRDTERSTENFTDRCAVKVTERYAHLFPEFPDLI
jgi:hypothetical protein